MLKYCLLVTLLEQKETEPQWLHEKQDETQLTFPWLWLTSAKQHIGCILRVLSKAMATALWVCLGLLGGNTISHIPSSGSASLDLGRDVIQKPTAAFTEETTAFRRAPFKFPSFYFSFFIPYHPVFPPHLLFLWRKLLWRTKCQRQQCSCCKKQMLF